MSDFECPHCRDVEGLSASHGLARHSLEHLCRITHEDDPRHLEWRRAVAEMAANRPVKPPPPVVQLPNSPRILPKHNVVIRGYLASWTGYGQIAEWLGRGLESAGLHVAYESLHTDERYLPLSPFVKERLGSFPDFPVVVQLATPHTPGDRRDRVAFTMWETDSLNKHAVDRLNEARLVVVPCAANVAWFQAAGVRRPIEVVPIGVSAAEGYYNDGPPGDEPFKFGMAGRMAHGGVRKGLNEGMQAFVEAFPPDVEVTLEIKVWEDCLPQLVVPPDPRIVIVTTPMRPYEMAAWYRSIDCLFVPSKGEGWGMHTHQAMACGRPVIATRWGGTAQFWTPDCGWELEYDLTPATEFYSDHGSWAIPKMESMVAQLRAAYNDYEGVIAKGKAAAERAAAFTWERTGMAMRTALETHDLIPMVRKPNPRLADEFLYRPAPAGATHEELAAWSRELVHGKASDRGEEDNTYYSVGACDYRGFHTYKEGCRCNWTRLCGLGKGKDGHVTDGDCIRCMSPEAEYQAIMNAEPSPVIATPCCGQDTPKPPANMLERGLMLGKAVVKFATQGGRIVDPTARLEICRTCEHYRPDEQKCAVCTCVLPIKARASTEVCPIGKWGEV